MSGHDASEYAVRRLKKMNSTNVTFKMTTFADVKVAQVVAIVARGQAQLRNLTFVKYGNLYVISFTAPPKLFSKYLLVVTNVLKSFESLPSISKSKEYFSLDEEKKIESIRIRVWIDALKHPGIGRDAERSLLSIGEPAIPALRNLLKVGTPLQIKRAQKVLKKILP